ncbi:MAG: ABC transporter ATP-binding protein [Actinomycetota bacterium]
MEHVLRASGLVKSYKRTRAVDGIDIEVLKGERVGLLGPNGAGKTTTLMMLLGAISPDEGSIEICDHRLPGGRSEAMQRVGFAAGYMPLAERLRVSEFLRMYGELYGVTDADGRIQAGLERFRISQLAEAMGTQLSSGQRTLVGIVKATLHRPRLLVLDEPTASLDPDVALRVRTGLRDLCDSEGTALLITSHNMVEIERLCERVIFLSRGKVIANNAPGAIASQFESDDLEGVFLHLARVAAEEPERAERRSQETDHTA